MEYWFTKLKREAMVVPSSRTPWEPAMRAYAEAVERRYRFFSYSDAMVVR